MERLRAPQLRQPELVKKAMGRQALALLAMLDAACAGTDALEQAATEQFRNHPDHAVITSFPGRADLTGARILAEIGDDTARFADDRALKAYAGSAPVTRASGRLTSITHRRIKNDRLAAVGWVWATCAAINPGPADGTTADAETMATATSPPCATGFRTTRRRTTTTGCRLTVSGIGDLWMRLEEINHRTQQQTGHQRRPCCNRRPSVFRDPLMSA